MNWKFWKKAKPEKSIDELAAEFAAKVPTPSSPPKPTHVVVPPARGGQTSEPSHPLNFLPSVKKELELVTPEFNFEIIPLIRKLVKVNPDLSQAHNDIIQLANTGHHIRFDQGVSPEQQIKMRREIEEASKTWGDGVSGIHGLINKLLSQIIIGGALSNEWVPNDELTGISNIVLVNPEDIRWLYNRTKKRYLAYQKVKNSIITVGKKDLIKLGPLTYRYAALNGDTDVPYGTPHYLAALKAVARQDKMIDNIDFITDMLGHLGYLNVTVEKPMQDTGESDNAYASRLTANLLKTKDAIRTGFRDGINVGYKDDHEFDFKTTTKDASGIDALWKQNEQLVASGIKFDSAFMGRNYDGSESLITILFTKMLSQLKNLQQLLEENLTFGYTLHLIMKGYKFDYLTVEFNKSTITDELKHQQAQEYKIRNLRVLFADGVINLSQYAEEMGYKKPDQAEPRAPIDPDGALAAEAARKTREAGKDASDRKTRDKNKPGGSKNVPTKTAP